MTPLDELEDPTIVERLLPEETGGEWAAFAFVKSGSEALIRPFPYLFVLNEEYKHRCVLMVRATYYKQQALTCGLSAVESHPPEDDVFAVQHTKETFTRRWYRRPVANPLAAPELVSTLEWVRETSVSPTSLRMVYDEDGETISQPACVPSVEGADPPEHWDGYSDPAYYYSHEDDEEYEDTGIITGSALVAAAQGGEIVSHEDAAFGLVKQFGRSWFSGGSLGVGVDAPMASQIGEVKRVTLRFKVVGHRIPFKLKWTREIFGGGALTNEEHQFSEEAGWEHTVETDYPPYGKTGSLYGFYVLPVGL